MTAGQPQLITDQPQVASNQAQQAQISQNQGSPAVSETVPLGVDSQGVWNGADLVPLFVANQHQTATINQKQSVGVSS